MCYLFILHYRKRELNEGPNNTHKLVAKLITKFSLNANGYNKALENQINLECWSLFNWVIHLACVPWIISYCAGIDCFLLLLCHIHMVWWDIVSGGILCLRKQKTLGRRKHAINSASCIIYSIMILFHMAY